MPRVLCDRCGVVPTGVGGSTRKHYCAPCQVARFQDNGGSAAHQAVARAVRLGQLPAAKTCACVDCGAPACDYDHRDYAKPLEVQPVCRKCNRARGPARPVLTFELPDADECGGVDVNPSGFDSLDLHGLKHAQPSHSTPLN